MIDFKLTTSEEFRKAWPSFTGRLVSAEIHNSEYLPELWREIGEATEWLRREYTVDTVKERGGISATRAAYKACGKDPSRYRPSNEQLCRRLLQGKDLYVVSTVVDLLNLASIRFGYSIGGFDAGKIAGDSVELGIGREGEPYEGIGRGPLNISGMPVYRDAEGGIGTPTSDNERTKTSLETTHLVCFVNGYDGDEAHTQGCAEYIAELLVKYCGTPEGSVRISSF